MLRGMDLNVETKSIVNNDLSCRLSGAHWIKHHETFLLQTRVLCDFILINKRKCIRQLRRTHIKMFSIEIIKLNLVLKYIIWCDKQIFVTRGKFHALLNLYKFCLAQENFKQLIHISLEQSFRSYA